MKREDFIKLSILSGLGIYVSPTWAFTNSSSLISLPPVNHHVRHSGLAQATLSASFSPQWITKIERHYFYENGFSPGNNDLQTFLFELDSLPVSVNILKKDIDIFIENEIYKSQWSDDTFSISINELKEEQKITIYPESKSFLIFPLQGVLKYDNNDFSDQFLYVNSVKSVEIQSNTESSFLIISKFK